MRKLGLMMAGLATTAILSGAAPAAGEEVVRTTAGQAAASLGARPVIAKGHDRKAGWLVAQHKDLEIRKQADKATGAITIDLRFGKDAVRVSLASGLVTVTRGGKRLALKSAENLEALQQLLGGSSAMFAVRALLSELERSSDYGAEETSLLSAAAFVASLAGDVEAPRRISDRFVEKHRGIFRQVALMRNCWGEYTTETTAAWDDLQSCMSDANNRGFVRAAYERLACNAIWLLRSESAWLEYVNCVLPIFE